MLDGGDLVGAATLSWSLDFWARFRGQAEVWRWAEDLLERRDELPPEWHNRVTTMAAQAAWLRGRLDQSESLARTVLDNDPTPQERHHALGSIGTVLLFKGDFLGSLEAWTASPLPDVAGPEIASASLSAAYHGDFDQARVLIGRARAAAEAAGVPVHLCWADYCSGEIEATEGTGLHAPYLDAAIREARRLGCVFILGVAMVTRASHRARDGEIAAAAENYTELIDIWLRSGSWAQMWTTLRNVAELLVGRDDETAVRLWAAADVAPHASLLTGDPRQRCDRLRDEIVGRHGADTVERLEAEARGIDRGTAVDEAIDALGHVTAVTPAPAGAAAHS
jgi:ATP/maltotriose-dependent transcriptional regulator MalT